MAQPDRSHDPGRLGIPAWDGPGNRVIAGDKTHPEVCMKAEPALGKQAQQVQGRAQHRPHDNHRARASLDL